MIVLNEMKLCDIDSVYSIKYDMIFRKSPALKWNWNGYQLVSMATVKDPLKTH